MGAGAKRALRLPAEKERESSRTWGVRTLARCKAASKRRVSLPKGAGGDAFLRTETKKSACSCCALQGAPCCSFETACVCAKGKF